MRLALLIFTALGLALAAFFLWPSSINHKPNAETFLSQHWQRPLPPQGLPPSHFSDLEASLSPRSCGQCHQEQYQDWQQSLHSKTMGPGILWQLPLMSQADGNKCLECHAPLAEQKALLALDLQWPNRPSDTVPAYISDDLDKQGLICASCHVRQHQRFGPIANTGQQTPIHGGFIEQEAFSSSAFCSSCHQFPEDWPRTNGKLRENTYQEWLASPYAEQGVQCQSCHMPDRKHQWQGVHSESMVGKAVSSSLNIEQGIAKARLTNSGAGHNLPTYLIPKLHLQLLAVQEDKETLLNEKIIGWQVSQDLETEQFDTRLAPFESVELSADVQAYQGAVIELRLLVDPDQHYRETFKLSLRQAEEVGGVDTKVLSLLNQAYMNSQQSQFTLLLERYAL